MKNKTDKEQETRISEARLNDLTRYIPRMTGVKTLSLGKWYATKNNEIFKVIAEDTGNIDLRYLTIKVNLPACYEIPQAHWMRKAYYGELFELPRNRNIDYLKRYIYTQTCWNNLIKILYKNTLDFLQKDLIWAPCLYVGKGTLQKPKKELMSDDR